MKNKKNKTPETPKRFAYKLTPLLLTMSIAAIVVSLAAIALSVYNIVESGISGFWDALKYPLLILISVFLLVLIIALLIRSEYTLDEKTFSTRFGLIKSSVKIKDITAIVLDRDTDKLTVTMGETFTVVSLQPSWREEFIRALLDYNKNIDYSYIIKDEEPKKKK